VKRLQRSESENLNHLGYSKLVDYAHDVLTSIVESSGMPTTPSEAYWWPTMDAQGRKLIALVLSSRSRSRSRFFRVAFTPDELKDPQARLEKVWADFRH
jgi:hypothetical protein